MEVQVMNQKLRFQNDISNIEVIFNKINEILVNNKMIFSHLIIDDEAIYKDFPQYIKERIADIKYIEVMAQNQEEYIQGIIQEKINFINSAIPQIKMLSEKFYQNQETGIWQEIPELIEELQHFFQSYKVLSQQDELFSFINAELWNKYSEGINNLNEIISPLAEALEYNDIILTADILRYEMVDSLYNLRKLLEKILSDKGEKI